MSTTSIPAPIRRHVAAVRRKLVLQRFVRRAVVALLVVGGVAWAGTLAIELFDLRLPGGPWPWLGGGVGLALLIALGLALRNGPTAHDAAVAIDERLDLKTKFSTALAFAGSDDPFARLAVDDAAKSAARVDLRRKFPLAVPRSAAGIALWAAAIAVTVWLVDPLDFTQEAAADEQKQVDREAQAKAEAKAIIEQQEQAMAVVPPEVADREEFRVARNRLNQARMTLDNDPARARQTAKEAQDKLADALKNQIERGETFAKAKEQAKAFRNVETPAPEESGAVAEAHRALADAKFDEAVKSLEEAVDNFEQMTQEEKEQAAEQMQDLAAAMQNMASDPAAQQQAQQQLQQMGLTPQQAQQTQQLMQQAAQGSQQAQQQLQNQAQQAMQQMNNGQGPSQQQQQQFQQMMQGLQQQAGAQAQAQQMSQMAQQLAQSMQQQAQQGQGGQQSQQGNQAPQPGQGQQGMQQSAQQMNQALSQMQAVQQAASQMQQAQGMNQGQGQQGQGQGQQSGNQPGQSGNPGQTPGGQQPGQGGQNGQGTGGQQMSSPNTGQYGMQNPSEPGMGAGGGGQGMGGQGLPYAPAPFGVKQEQSFSHDDDEGRTIASTLIKGETLRGESTAAVREIVESEVKDVTDEVDTQRVSRRAEKAVRDYFQTMRRDAERAEADK